MKRHLIAAGTALALLLPLATADAQVTISIYDSVGPNANSSPSLSGFYTNSQTFLQGGAPANNGGPSDYVALANGSAIPVQNIVSSPSFSWNGMANPTGAFAGEQGNAVFASASIVAAAGTTFTLAGITGGITVADKNGVVGTIPLDLSGGFSDPRITAYTAGHVLVPTGAPASTPLTEIYLTGPGVGADATQFTSYAAPPNGTGTGTGNITQAQLDEGINTELGPTVPITFTGNFTVAFSNATGGGSASGSSSAVATIPEPASMAVFGIGLVGLAGYVRRRRQTTASAVV